MDRLTHASRGTTVEGRARTRETVDDKGLARGRARKAWKQRALESASRSVSGIASNVPDPAGNRRRDRDKRGDKIAP